MELTVSLNYLPKVTTAVRRRNGEYVSFLNREDSANCESKFWGENRNKFRCNIVNNLDIHEWIEIFEQVVDENVIDMSTFECIAFNTHFNNNTYEVNFDITFKFDILDETQFFIQSNRMKTLLYDWLNDNQGFISTGDNGAWVYNDGVDSFYDGSKIVVYYNVTVTREDVNVEIEVRK